VTKPVLQYVTVLASSLAYGVDFYLKLPFVADFVMLPAIVPNPDGQTFQANIIPAGGDLEKYALAVRLNDPTAPLLMLTGTASFVQNGVVIETEGGITEIYIRPMTVAGASASAIYGFTLLVGTGCDLGFYGAVFD